jgi:hypothetical protein
MPKALIIEDEKVMQDRISALIGQIQGLTIDCASNEQED